MNLEQMPMAMEQMQLIIAKMDEKLEAIYKQQPSSEPPITPKVLRERLGISETQEIRLRRRGDLPFIELGSNYRYIWVDVLTALANKSKRSNNKKASR